jgi:hypothetical protein
MSNLSIKKFVLAILAVAIVFGLFVCTQYSMRPGDVGQLPTDLRYVEDLPHSSLEKYISGGGTAESWKVD